MARGRGGAGRMAVVARERTVDVRAVPAPSSWAGRMRPEAAALAARRHLRALRGVPAQQARQGVEYDRMFGGEGAFGAYLRTLGAWADAAGPHIAQRSDALAERIGALSLDHDTPLADVTPSSQPPAIEAMTARIATLAPIGARGGVRPLGRTRQRDAAAARQAKDVLAAHDDILAAWSESAASLAMEGEARLDALRRLGTLDAALRALVARAQGGDDRARELAVLTRLARIDAHADARITAADRVRRTVLSVNPWGAESVGAALDDAAGDAQAGTIVPAARERMERWLADHPQDRVGDDILRSRFGLGRPAEDPDVTQQRLGLTPRSYGRRLERAMRRLDIAAPNGA